MLGDSSRAIVPRNAAWADALPVFGERRSLKYSDRPYTYAPAYAGLCKIRTTALSVGAFQISEPYASLAVTRVGSSRPCRLQITNNGSNDAEATKGIENITEPLTNLRVRIQNPAAIRR